MAVSCCGCAGDDGDGELSVGGSVVSLKGTKGGVVGDIVRVVVVGMLTLASKLGYSSRPASDRYGLFHVYSGIPHRCP